MASAVENLIEDLQSSDLTIRRTVAESLSRIATEAASDAPALVSACRDDDEQVRDGSSPPLEDLPAPPSRCAEALSALLRDESTDVVYWATTLLGRMQADASPAVPNLTASWQLTRRLRYVNEQHGH